MTNHPYRVEIKWSGEDQVFIASVIELNGVCTHGETKELAAKAAEEVIALHIKSLRRRGEDIP